MFPLVVHQPAYLASSAVTPEGSVHKSRGDNVVHMWVQLKRCVWMLQRGHSGDGCVLASTLCKYDLRKGDLFVLSWARVRRVRGGSIFSDVCIWRMFVFMSVVVTVWGSGNDCCVAAVVKNSVFL